MKPLSVDLLSSSSGPARVLRGADRGDMPVRAHRVLQARAAIARGDYDRPAVLQWTIERLVASGHL
jgi:hypothetical protein